MKGLLKPLESVVGCMVWHTSGSSAEWQLATGMTNDSSDVACCSGAPLIAAFAIALDVAGRSKY
jgi:hypothetical protein